MSDGQPGGECRECAAECARRIPLYDHHVALSQKRQESGSDLPHMQVRVLLASTPKAHDRIAPEAIVFEAELRMLSRQHESATSAEAGQSTCDRSHFDRFRPGADDQPDVGETQYSP